MTKMILKYIFILGVCSVCISSVEDISFEFKKGVFESVKNGKVTDEFWQLISATNLSRLFDFKTKNYIDSNLLCTACVAVVDAVILERRNGASAEDLSAIVVEMCILLGIDTRQACEGFVNINVNIGLYIVDNKPDLRAEHMCAVVGQSYGCEGNIPEWSINLPPKTQIPTIKDETFDSQPLRILHLTDIHFDPLYLPGSNAICDTYVCCQSDLGMADDPDNGAGYWGDYRGCDTPLNVIESAFQQIKEEHEDFDYIYFTGDIISHRMWDTSRERNLNTIHFIQGKLETAFPNTKLFSVFGNHEAHPVNVFAPPSVEDDNVSSQWLYDDAAEIWGRQLPQEARETIRRGGFYTVLLEPGFRLIALNGNAGYIFNWWILYETGDFLGQLQWLSDTLYEAERNGEKVHILNHIPSSDATCSNLWSREFRRILERYSKIITGIFVGHTHQNEFTLFHSSVDSTKPIGLAWNGGSLTAISNLNSNYKVFSVNAGTFEILDYELWAYNLTDANLTPENLPTWYKLYEFKDIYGMTDLAPNSIRDLAWRMVEDRSLLYQYFRFRSREADPALAAGCNSDCLRGLLCRMLRSETTDNTQCNEFTGVW